MKKLSMIATAILVAFSSYSQEIRLNLGVSLNSAQLEWEKSVKSVYVKAQIEHDFTENFNNMGFGIGYNTYLDRVEDVRFFIGVKAGVIAHKKQTYDGNATFGFESGVGYKLTESTTLGGKYSLDWREDLKYFGVNYEPSFKGHFSLVLTYKLK